MQSAPERDDSWVLVDIELKAVSPEVAVRQVIDGLPESSEGGLPPRDALTSFPIENGDVPAPLVYEQSICLSCKA